ncbi:hypothetical protein ACFE04_031373 [Oxalis oulophora]
MGCFMSINKGKFEQQHDIQSPFFSSESRAPPPSADEETIVKEVVVLSVNETSLPISQSTQQNQTTLKVDNFDSSSHSHSHSHLLYKSNKAQNFLHKNNNISTSTTTNNVSEICSVSTTTTTTTTDHVDFQEVEQNPTKNRVLTRKPSESPVRQNGFGNNHGMVKRVGSKSEFNRRDPGESSGRRSRSPVTNRSVLMGRSPSGKRCSNPTQHDPREERCGNNMEQCKWSPPPPKKNNRLSSSSSSREESLENPLVSLECFIFL